MSNDYGFLVNNAKGDALESSDGVFKLLYVVDLPWVNGGLWHPKTSNKYPWSGNSSYPYMCVRIFDEVFANQERINVVADGFADWFIFKKNDKHCLQIAPNVGLVGSRGGMFNDLYNALDNADQNKPATRLLIYKIG